MLKKKKKRERTSDSDKCNTWMKLKNIKLSKKSQTQKE